MIRGLALRRVDAPRSEYCSCSCARTLIAATAAAGGAIGAVGAQWSGVELTECVGSSDTAPDGVIRGGATGAAATGGARPPSELT